jgi:hypothetical protein
MAPRAPLSALFGSLRVRIAIVTAAVVALTAVVGTQLTRDRLRSARQSAVRVEADLLARGLRVRETEEESGLDISEHGMHGYPEQFIAAEAATNGSSPLGDGARA